jgi:hypothetical protein
MCSWGYYLMFPYMYILRNVQIRVNIFISSNICFFVVRTFHSFLPAIAHESCFLISQYPLIKLSPPPPPPTILMSRNDHSTFNFCEINFFFFLILHASEITWYLSFCAWQVT